MFGKSAKVVQATPADIHRNAFNAAFYELGLRWHWDDAIYQTELCTEGERDCLRSYLKSHQSHLLKAYDAEFLIDAIQTTKARYYETMTAEGSRPATPVNWAELHQHQVGH
jgi:hypothetical protein